MLIAYIDESGDTGIVARGGSLTYTLGCVLIDADQWPAAFEEMLIFRRRLKATFGVLMRAEIKASYLLRNRGDFLRLGLGPGARCIIYRAHMQQLARLRARAFAVVVDKRNSTQPPSDAPQDFWWMIRCPGSPMPLISSKLLTLWRTPRSALRSPRLQG